MVFCNTLNSSRAVDHFLSENQISTVNYHGEVPAEQRQVKTIYPSFFPTHPFPFVFLPSLNMCTNALYKVQNFVCILSVLQTLLFAKRPKTHVISCCREYKMMSSLRKIASVFFLILRLLENILLHYVTIRKYTPRLDDSIINFRSYFVFILLSE